MDQFNSKDIKYTDFVDFDELEDDEQFMVEIENIIAENLPEILRANSIENVVPIGVDENDDFSMINSVNSSNLDNIGFNTEVAESAVNIAPVKTLNLQAQSDLPFKFFDIDGTFLFFLFNSS